MMNQFTEPYFHPTNRAASVFSKSQWLYKLTAWLVVASLLVVPTAWGQVVVQEPIVIISPDQPPPKPPVATPNISIGSCADAKNFLIPETFPYYQHCLTSDNPESGRSPLSPATIAALKEYADCAICMAQKLYGRAPSLGEALLMTYTLLGTSKTNPNESDRLALQWLENRIKEQRILAATVAQSEHARWKEAPCAYTPPVNTWYNDSQCKKGSKLNLVSIAGVPPPNFGEIGIKVANKDLGSPAIAALLKDVQEAIITTAALEGAGSIAGGLVVGGVTTAVIIHSFTALFPLSSAVAAASLAAGTAASTAATAAGATPAAAATAGALAKAAALKTGFATGFTALGGATGGTIAFLMAGPAIAATLAAVGIAAIVLLVRTEQLPDKLSGELQRAQNESINLATLLTTDSGKEEAWGNFLLATANTKWTPRTYNCSNVDVSRHTLSLPASAQPEPWLFQHTKRGASSSHSAEIMKYVGWNGSQWTAKIVDGQFLHAPNGDFNQAHPADILNYRGWDGTNWTAQISNGVFRHAPNGDFNRAHTDTILNYRTWDGGDWTTSLVASAPVAKNWRFQHTQRGTGSSHTAEIMNYISGDGSHWTAKIVDGQFLHAPNGDFTRAHRDDIMIYSWWDGSSWTAKIVDGQFLHAPNGDFTRAHPAPYLQYKIWDGSEWLASLVEEGNL